MRNATIVFDLDGTLVDSAPGSLVTTDLFNLASKVFADKVEPPPPAAGGRRPFNSLFKRSSTSVQDFGLNAALERANLGEAQ